MRNKKQNNQKNLQKFFQQYKKTISIIAITIVGVFLLNGAFASTVFQDNFDSYPEGLMTSEYSYWNPSATNAVKNAIWEMTSGSLFATTLNSAKVAYSGYPTFETKSIASPTPTSGNNSAVFRLTSILSNFNNVNVSFRLLVKQQVSTSGTPSVSWDGIHVFLRYQSEENLYYASVNRRDGAIVIKKKTAGGTTNGGTYYTLASTSSNRYPIPLQSWQNIKASIKTNTDNSVTIQVVNNGTLLLSAVDNGSIGGAPILNPGKVGIRGDNTEFYFDDFIVDDPTIIDDSSSGNSSTDTIPPTVSLTAPTAGTILKGTVTVSSSATDNVGIAKVDYYSGSTLLGSSNQAPYSFLWDTTQASQGDHSLYAIAYDTSQNYTRSTAVTVKVDNQTVNPPSDTITPTVKITSPIEGALVGKSVKIVASSTDNVGVAKMYVYINGELRFSTSGSSVSTTQGIKKKGVNTITVTAVDRAGNIGRSVVNVYQ